MAREIDRRRREAVVALDDRLHAVGREHLERRALRGVGQGVGVLAQKQRAVDALARAVLADGLRDGEDVGLVEAAAQGRAAMAAGAEAHELRGVVSVGLSGVVLALEVSEVHQEFTRRGVAGERGERVSFGSRHGRRGEPNTGP